MKINVLPHAGIMKKGDCGACCIGTIAGISVKGVYDVINEPRYLSYHLVLTILQRLAIEHENWLPKYHMIDNREDWFTFGYPAYQNWYEWFRVSEGRTNRKMIGIAHVNSKGKANIDTYADHWVLITVSNNGEHYKDKIVHINCPTKGHHSVNAQEFLMKWGGYNAIWVHPKANIF